MAKRDGKDRFYRNLNLDKKTRQIIKWFRKVKEDMVKDCDREKGRS